MMEKHYTFTDLVDKFCELYPQEDKAEVVKRVIRMVFGSASVITAATSDGTFTHTFTLKPDDPRTAKDIEGDNHDCY